MPRTVKTPRALISSSSPPPPSTETLTQIAEMYKEVAPNVNITYNFDSSGKLLTQISEGADCDLFISAAPQQTERHGRKPH